MIKFLLINSIEPIGDFLIIISIFLIAMILETIIESKVKENKENDENEQ